MELIYLIDSDGKERITTKTAWKHQPEQDRLKRSGWRLKPAEAAKVEPAPEDQETKTKKSQKNG